MSDWLDKVIPDGDYTVDAAWLRERYRDIEAIVRADIIDRLRIAVSPDEDDSYNAGLVLADFIVRTTEVRAYA